MPTDNIAITAGSGTSVRTLADSSGVEWPAGVVCYATSVSSGANSLQVVTASAGLPVAQQGTWTVTANAGTGTMAVSAASLPLPAGAATESTLSTLSGKVTACNTGAVVISGALPAGSNTVGGVNLAQYTPASGRLPVDGSGVTQPVSPQAAAAGGATPYSYIAAGAANQDSQVVKSSAGQLYGLALYNTSASARYVKFYNKATAPTSADTPVARHFLPAGGGAVVPHPVGAAYSAGISFRITTGVADSDANAATANDVIVTATYK